MNYRLFQFKQKSQEWKNWRNQGIGASDSPAIMGYSPYGNAKKLFEEKIGLRQPKGIPQHVEDRAERIERAARSEFNLMNDANCIPVCAEMVEHPFIKASLDGFDEERGIIIEVKYVGLKALGENVVAHHWCQLQHQLMVFGLPEIIIIRSNNGIDFVPQMFERDEKFISELLKEELAFKKAWDDALVKV